MRLKSNHNAEMVWCVSVLSGARCIKQKPNHRPYKTHRARGLQQAISLRGSGLDLSGAIDAPQGECLGAGQVGSCRRAELSFWSASGCCVLFAVCC